MKSTLLFLAPSLAAATVPAIFARGCGDNCARAVIAKAYTTRDGAGDCAAFLRTTVTPSAVTVTATVTDFFSVTSTELATETTLTTTTYASTDVAVVKETAQETVTVTSIAAALKKRDDPAPTIPAYASACSGEARYSTACACVGVTMVTITAAIPTSTVTVSESTTASFSETTTVATEVIVSTSTSIESTTTTTTDATATATQTAVVAPAKFKLRSTSNGKFLNPQLPEVFGVYRSTLGFTGDASKAAVFSFSTPTGGQLSQVSGSKSYPLLAGTNSNNPVVVANPAGAGIDTSFKPAVCSFTGAKVSCAWAASASTPRSWSILPGFNTLLLGNPSNFIGATIELEIVAA